MKKIWAVLLSLPGLSNQSFAGCYEEAMNYSFSASVQAELGYCDSDALLDELDYTLETYHETTDWTMKYQLGQQIQIIIRTLKAHGVNEFDGFNLNNLLDIKPSCDSCID